MQLYSTSTVAIGHQILFKFTFRCEISLKCILTLTRGLIYCLMIVESFVSLRQLELS